MVRTADQNPTFAPYIERHFTWDLYIKYLLWSFEHFVNSPFKDTHGENFHTDHHLLHVKVQGDQLNVAVFVGTFSKTTFSAYTCTVAYTWQIFFYKVLENTAMFNWSPITMYTVNIY